MDIRETLTALHKIQEMIADAMERFPEGIMELDVAFESLDQAGLHVEVAIDLVTRQLKNEVPSVDKKD